MKTLIGKIYRDENGVETIEREPIKKYRVGWRITKVPPLKDDFPSRFEVECPQCHHKWYKSYVSYGYGLQERMEKFGARESIYCGHCGQKNIFEIV